MVVTNDPKYAEKVRLLRNMAFTQPRFRHEEAGYNFRMTGYQAAMGVVQAGKLEKVIAEKRRMAHTYNRYLKDVPGLQLPPELPWARNVYWMYAVNVRPEFGRTRDELIQSLAKDGVDTRTFFFPMNLQPCFQSQPGFRRTACPVAEELWKTGLYLPSGQTLTEEQIRFVSECVKKAAR